MDRKSLCNIAGRGEDATAPRLFLFSCNLSEVCVCARVRAAIYSRGVCVCVCVGACVRACVCVRAC